MEIQNIDANTLRLSSKKDFLPKFPAPEAQTTVLEKAPLPQQEQTVLFYEKPSLQLKKIESLYHALCTHIDIQSLIAQLSQQDFKAGLARLHSSGHPLYLYANLLSGHTASLQFQQSTAPSLNPESAVFAAVKLLKANIKAIDPSEYFGPHTSDPKTLDDYHTSLYRELRQRVITTSTSILGEQLSEKHLFAKRKMADRQTTTVEAQSEQPQVTVVPENSTTSGRETDSQAKSDIEFFLLPAKSREIPTQEPVFDLKREQAFAIVQNAFVDLYHQSPDHHEFHDWFVSKYSSALGLSGERQLTLEDVSSLELIIWESTEINQVAQTQVQRPIFVFRDRGQYFKFMKKMYDKDTTTSGMYITFDIDEEPTPLSEAGFIFVSREKVHEIEHEIIHSIDPYVKVRRGYNKLITEVLAFYRDNINEPKEYKKLLGHYYKQFTSQLEASNHVSLDTYNEYVSKVVDLVTASHAKIGQEATLRKLFLVKTLDEALQAFDN